MRQGNVQLVMPKPGKGLIVLIASLVVAYVFQLLALRANLSFVADLALTPTQVFHGSVWQLVTYMWLHDPENVGHLFWNLLWLYWFAARLERHYGTPRFFGYYLLFGVSGAILTLIVAVASGLDALAPLIGGFANHTVVGASGGVMGMVVAYGVLFANEEMNLLLIGSLKVRTFVLVVVAFELIRALSFDRVSSTAHFGGMAAGALVAGAGPFVRRQQLERKRKKIEGELRVLQGGGAHAEPDPDPKKWN